MRPPGDDYVREDALLTALATVGGDATLALVESSGPAGGVAGRRQRDLLQLPAAERLRLAAAAGWEEDESALALLDRGAAAEGLRLAASLFSAMAVELRSRGGQALPLPWGGGGRSLAADPALLATGPGPRQAEAKAASLAPDAMCDTESGPRPADFAEAEERCDGGGVSAASAARASPLLGEDGEDLLWRLLLWDPEARLRVDEALLHPFIHPAAAAA